MIKVEPREFSIYKPRDGVKVILGGIEGETREEYIERMIKTYSTFPAVTMKKSALDKIRQREIFIKKEKLRKGIDILLEYTSRSVSPGPVSRNISNYPHYVIKFVENWQASENELRDMFGYKECIYTRNLHAKGKCPPIHLSIVRCTTCKLSQ
tara:strand:- start:1945 stop:2403 length:459 start_codon:yes stop_codon:yes gene_type:complete